MSSPRRPVRALTAVDALVALAVALFYVGAAKLGLALAIDAPQVTAVWPPTGLALAAVWLLGPRAVAGVLLGAFAANASLGEPLWVAAGIAVGNTLEAVVGVALLRRVGFDGRLARVVGATPLVGGQNAPEVQRVRRRDHEGSGLRAPADLPQKSDGLGQRVLLAVEEGS